MHDGKNKHWNVEFVRLFLHWSLLKIVISNVNQSFNFSYDDVPFVRSIFMFIKRVFSIYIKVTTYISQQCSVAVLRPKGFPFTENFVIAQYNDSILVHFSPQKRNFWVCFDFQEYENWMWQENCRFLDRIGLTYRECSNSIKRGGDKSTSRYFVSSWASDQAIIYFNKASRCSRTRGI